MDSENIFDSTRHDFVVLTNVEEQYSLWPSFVDIPDGWTSSFGPAHRDECIGFISEHWTDMRPAGLRHKLLDAHSGPTR